MPMFLLTVACSQKSQQTFTLTILCNIVITIKADRSQRGLLQCYNCQIFGQADTKVSLVRERTSSPTKPQEEQWS